MSDIEDLVSENQDPWTRCRSIKDPVHDYISVSPRLSSFIDTRQFQRLRAVKQLGTSYYVWPGASHNRFEHCLGVAYLARLMARHLQRSQPSLKITDRDVECVEIAGLCHDLGHGPWSHVWDNIFMPRVLTNQKWRHEDGSEMMLDYLVKDNDINIAEEDLVFIKALIAGEPKRCSQPEKPFLFEIVCNNRNGIDVDKFDYISRDTHAIGEKGNLSLTRLIRSARVIEDQICYDIKDANQMYELFYTRFSLHKRIYNHKTAKAIEYMIVDALIAAEPFFHFSDQVFQPEKFVYLTDDIMPRIESSTEIELADSRAIFDRIRARDLYKLVDYKVFGWGDRERCKEFITPERIVEEAKSFAADYMPGMFDSQSDMVEAREIADSLDPRHVIVDHSEMHHGMKEKNPMDFVKFYSKQNPNSCYSAGKGDISILTPDSFGETLLRVFTRDARYFGIVQTGYRRVLETIPDHFSPGPEIPPEDSGSLTPPATEPPTTPRSQSRNASFSLTGTGDKTPLGSSSKYLNNAFTTVPPTFAPPSPTRNKKAKGGKRQRDVNVEGESRHKKRKE